MFRGFKFILTFAASLAILGSAWGQKNSSERFYSLGLRFYYGSSTDADSLLHYWDQAAQSGHALAAYNLGLLYEEGRMFPADPVKAARYFHMAAELGDMFAQYVYGLYLAQGIGVDADSHAATLWLEKSANQNYAPAMRELGVLYESLADPQCTTNCTVIRKAIKWYELASAQSDPEAIYRLGNLYFEGRGTDVNWIKACALYKKAAELGYADAQFALGICYRFGYGISLVDYRPDITKAVRWFRSAASLGSSDAMYQLGTIYSSSEEVPRNLDSALLFLRQSALLGNPLGLYSLGTCYYHGLGVPVSYDSVLILMTRASEMGVVDATYTLGTMYYNGTGVDQDYLKAYRYLEKAAIQRDNRALYLLGYMYFMGQGVECNYTKAILLFDDAALEGNASAYQFLGKAYEEGLGCEKNLDTAFTCYGYGAQLDNLECKYHMVRIFLNNPDHFSVRDEYSALNNLAQCFRKNHPGARSLIPLLSPAQKAYLMEVSEMISQEEAAANPPSRKKKPVVLQQ